MRQHLARVPVLVYSEEGEYWTQSWHRETTAQRQMLFIFSDSVDLQFSITQNWKILNF